MKRIVLAVCALTCSAFGARAADDASCVAAIRDAVASDGKESVPQTCWRIGPVALGQSKEQVREALGTPDTDYFVTSTASLWPGMEQYRYVFPRNLRATLARHPIDRAAFKPVTLDVNFIDGRAVALNIAMIHWTGDSQCVPRETPLPDAGIDMRFPYTFDGVAVDAPLDRFVAKFGRWTDSHTATEIGSRRNRDFLVFTYKALGLAISTFDKKHPRIVALAVAPAYRGFASQRVFAPYYEPLLDPRTCRVNGFTTQ